TTIFPLPTNPQVPVMPPGMGLSIDQSPSGPSEKSNAWTALVYLLLCLVPATIASRFVRFWTEGRFVWTRLAIVIAPFGNMSPRSCQVKEPVTPVKDPVCPPAAGWLLVTMVTGPDSKVAVVPIVLTNRSSWSVAENVSTGTFTVATCDESPPGA